MLGAIRNLILLVLVLGFVWFAFSVPLGNKTLAQHVDQISETREAKALVDGTRAKVNPVLEDLESRILGEHIEAPTVDAAGLAGELGEALAEDRLMSAGAEQAPGFGGPAKTREAPEGDEPRLPGH